MKNNPTKEQYLGICNFFADSYNRFFPGSPIKIELNESVDQDFSNPSFSVKYPQDSNNGGDMFFALAEMYLTKLSALKGEYVDVSISYRENSVVEEDNPRDDRVYQFNFGNNNIEEVIASLHRALEIDPLNTDDMKNMTYYDAEGRDLMGQKLPVLNMPGIALINYNKSQQYKEEKRPNENIFICGSDEIFLKTMELLSREDVPDNLDLVLIKRCGAGHAQSIKLERRKGQNNFIIVDSTPDGNDFSASYPMMTFLMLRKYFPDAKIYSLKEQRQFNRVGCHTYAIKDSQILSASKDMHKELEVSEKEETQKNIFLCRSPGKFFVFAQSRDGIKKYTGGDLNFSFVDKDEITPHKLLGIDRGEIYRRREVGGVVHPYVDRKGLVPSAIDYFARKYSKRIEEMRSQKTEVELKDIIDSQNAGFLTMNKIKEIAHLQYGGVSQIAASQLKVDTLVKS